MGEAIRIEDDGAVRHLVLCRPDEYNTITVALRDELGAALDAADADNAVRVVLLRAEGKAFCAGFGLDWSTASQASRGRRPGRVWDTVADVRMIGTFGNTFAKLHSISKPTLAAVQGWCIAGGTDMVLNADLIVAGESARFGYPPARVWGVPEAPVGVGGPARPGASQALPLHRRRAHGDRGGGRRDDPRVRARRRAARRTPPRSRTGWPRCR